jgi:hypothetical protein
MGNLRGGQLNLKESFRSRIIMVYQPGNLQKLWKSVCKGRRICDASLPEAHMQTQTASPHKAKPEANREEERIQNPR